MSFLLLLACTSSKSTDTSVEEDLDGDGYISWELTDNPEEADCDDNDSQITPLKYRFIAEGEFIRGDSRGEHATPQTNIFISNFCMDRFERSNTDFVSFLNQQAALGLVNADELGREWYDIDDNDDEYPARIIQYDDQFEVVQGYETHPVVEIHHWAGDAFCQHVGMRLPTEAEWEKAARGTDGRTYPWGDNEPDCSIANFWPRGNNGMPAERCVDDTMPQASLEDGQSPYGIYNMAGNVSEWTADYFQSTHYETAAERDPHGPSDGWHTDIMHPEGFEAVVARGGSLGTGSGSLRVFHRMPEPVDATSNGLGFRCIFEPR